MKKWQITTIAAIMLLTLALVASAGDDEKSGATKQTEIVWMSYDAGLVKAKAENKHIFVNFTTAWCGWCKKMNKTTFKDAEIIGMLGDNFVAVKVYGDSKNELDIDGYKITEQSLAKSEFGVRGYPTYYFLGPDGSKLNTQDGNRVRLSGYQQKQQLSQALAFVAGRKYDTTKVQNPGQKRGGK